jgi:hypothetical protein
VEDLPHCPYVLEM